MNKLSYIYIIGNKKHGVLYIGVTNNLIKRIHEHKYSTSKGFTKKYNCHKLFYYEQFEDIEEAIKREKNLKNWKREWKIKLIESKNMEWKDLYEDIKNDFI